MSGSDLETASAIELAKLIRARSVSSEVLVRACLARIAQYDPNGSVFVQVLADRAIREAQKKDALLAKGDHSALPPFFGVPTAIKDLNLVRGAFTRFGSRAFKWVWSPVDDRTVARVRRGGFVILGKLATSELGALPITEPATHPPTTTRWSSATPDATVTCTRDSSPPGRKQPPLSSASVRGNRQKGRGNARRLRVSPLSSARLATTARSLMPTRS